MEIRLFNNQSENIEVVKRTSLYDIDKLDGTLREETSIEEPEILFEMQHVPEFNYVYIPAFYRYYYVVEIFSVRTRLWRMRLHVDVLMSFKERILAQKAIIARNQYEYDLYLIDDKIPAKVQTVYSAPVVFPKAPFTPGTARTKLLVVNGQRGIGGV